MQGHDNFCLRRKLHFGHHQQRMADTVPHVFADRIIEQRAAVIANADLTADTLRMKTIAHQCDRDVHMRQSLHPHGVVNAKTLQRDTGQDRVDGWGFEFETERACVRHGVEKVV